MEKTLWVHMGGDIDKLRELFFELIISQEKPMFRIGKDIGLAPQTIKRFRDAKEIDFKSLSKIYVYVKRNMYKKEKVVDKISTI